MENYIFFFSYRIFDHMNCCALVVGKQKVRHSEEDLFANGREADDVVAAATERYGSYHLLAGHGSDR